MYAVGGTLSLTTGTVVSSNVAIGGSGGGGGTGPSLSSVPGGDGGSGQGGGVYANNETVTITDGTLCGNSATGSGGGTGGGGEGGPGGTGGSGQGGGLYATNETVAITNGTLSGNSATGSEGGNGGNSYSGGPGGAGGSGQGGGVYANNETVTITNVALSGNTATGGGGGYSVYGSYSGGYPGGAGGSGQGGGVYALDGTVTITNGTLGGNTAIGSVGGNGGGGSDCGCGNSYSGGPGGAGGSGQGGGVYATNETVALTNVTLSGNSATGSGGGDGGNGYSGGNGGTGGSGQGAGVYANDETVTITNVTLSGNTATGSEGGNGSGGSGGGSGSDGSNGTGGGGGLFNTNDGQVWIANSTISGNSATDAGGGIYSDATLTVTNSTIAYNSAGSTGSGGGLMAAGNNPLFVPTLDNTIVALNISGSGATPDDIAGTVSLASAFNLIGTGGSGGLSNGVNGNQVGVADPGLGPLAYYGGSTQTIALLTGSPAIDNGSNALAVDPSTGQPLTTDQRGPGFLRIVNGTVDIGAYEYLPAASDAVSVEWGSQSAALQTAADGLRLLPQGRTTDLPWLGIDSLQVTLSQAQTLTPADVTVEQRHRRQLRTGHRLRLGDELYHHPGPADQRGRPGHDHHRQPRCFHVQPQARRPAGRFQRRRGGQQPGYGGHPQRDARSDGGDADDLRRHQR